MSKHVYVSITGLRVRAIWHLPRFWRYAIASMQQAQAASGCVSAGARTINGVHHTRSVWTSREAMRDFLHSGPHLAAMQDFHKIATGKTLGFEATEVPDWSQVHQLWLDRGRDV